MVKVIYSDKPTLNIRYLSAHRSKGLEADAVFILNTKHGTYGFPSMVQNHPLMQEFLEKDDTFPYGEERRLFYVALTRSRGKVWLLVDRENCSNFVDELRGDEKVIMSPQITKVIGPCPLCGGKLMLRESETGNFYGCSNYPVCHYTRPVSLFKRVGNHPRKLNEQYLTENQKKYRKICPVCGSDLVRRESNFGSFYGCLNFPQCTYIQQIGKRRRYTKKR